MINIATIRDYTYLAANMRPADWREISCQLPPEAKPVDVALMSLQAREAWTATVRGQPAAAFGISDATPARNVVSLWAWGTRLLPRAAPEVTRFVRARVPVWIEQGINRVEVRSIVGHDLAHRWLGNLGATQDCVLKGFGRNEEDFLLWSWTCSSWRKLISPDPSSLP